MKKILIAVALIFSLSLSPLAEYISYHDDYNANARSYRRSGKRSFNRQPSVRQNEPRSNFSNRRNGTVNRGVTRSNRGGFARGLLYGGLAGLLFGGLLGHMGALGGIFGLLINILAIVLVINLILRFFRSSRRDNNWR
ncbi:hypothetical protein V7158_29475 [Priestia megaterium]|uniref:hypothetical protein n=1 Tax=Priestia megaterium TaxID=1404 RepID=UPI002FFF99E7